MNTLREHQKPFRYFMPQGETPGLYRQRPERLRVAIITSIRDLIAEGVGQHKDTSMGEDAYVKGTLEYAIQESIRGKLAHFLEIVLVINDDTQRDMDKLGNPMPLRPQREMPWVHPVNMRTRSGELVSGITRNIPSNFRLLPLHEKEKRATEKRKFEDSIRGAMEAHDAQVLISDHYLCRVDYLIDDACCDLRNKVLNTHPGISDPYHRFRTPGATPYTDAIDRAAGRRGDIHNRTGASFHLMRKEIDAGPVLVDVERTPVFATDAWSTVCNRNYPLSKNPAFAEGLIHYAEHYYPRLNQIDLQTLEPYETDRALYEQAA